ncbi:MAG: single-stranded DNA-binding protein [Bacteroidales bacterium]|nr:single-stranded DNA-binding protein [Bacteroidales bacterium]
MSINKAILIGNVGKDPEINYINEDLPVARFTLATSETYTKDGQKVTNTEWHNIVVWRGLAKVVEQYVKKGSKLYIEGKITNRQYEKDGQTRYISEIVANNMQMLDSKSSSNDTGSTPTPPPPPPMSSDDTGDDLPF